MTKVATYLNFKSSTEEAFRFYQSVFNPEYELQFMRYGDIPGDDSHQLPDEVKKLIMHTQLSIFNDTHILMGSDVPDFTGIPLKSGNDVAVMLMPETKAEADRLFGLLSNGGDIEQSMQDMFWGDYYGAFSDKFGIHWMINVSTPE